MLYLCTPYSHSDPVVMHRRFLDACEAAARLMNAGHLLFAPIPHTHPIAMAGDLPKGWEYWQKYDRWFIERADVVVIVMMEGWEDSRGIAAERKIAEELGKPTVCVRFGREVEDYAAWLGTRPVA